MDNASFIAELSKLRSSSTFLTLKSYRNNFSEIADYSIVFHMSYESALKKSIATLEAMDVPTDLEKQAKSELLESFHNSLTKMADTPIEDLDDCYIRFQGCKGVKIHKETGALYIWGSVVHKRVLMPGTPYPKKNKRALTIAKDKLRFLTQCGKFRQFKIDPSQVDRIVVEGLSLLPPETIDEQG